MAMPFSGIGIRWKMRRFGRFLNSGTGSLAERFGASEAALKCREMREEYKSLIPRVPYVGGRRNRWS